MYQPSFFLCIWSLKKGVGGGGLLSKTSIVRQTTTSKSPYFRILILQYSILLLLCSILVLRSEEIIYVVSCCALTVAQGRRYSTELYESSALYFDTLKQVTNSPRLHERNDMTESIRIQKDRSRWQSIHVILRRMRSHVQCGSHNYKCDSKTSNVPVNNVEASIEPQNYIWSRLMTTMSCNEFVLNWYSGTRP